jgi:hypothetical protein
VAKNTIYVDVMHLDYWWGIYGLTPKTNWEDIVMYVKKGLRYKKIGWICVCSKQYFENGFEDLEKDPEEREFVQLIKEFLEKDEIKYHYYYDNPDDKDFYEVPFEAERNERNIKPRSIEMWYPNKGIDKETIDDCVKNFCQKFLNIDVDRIEYKEVISIDEANKEYSESIKQWQQCKGIFFSDELIQSLEKEMDVPEEKVLEILNRSIK